MSSMGQISLTTKQKSQIDPSHLTQCIPVQKLKGNITSCPVMITAVFYNGR